MLRIAATGILLFFANSAGAQNDAPPTEFEVASIKPFVRPTPGAGRAMVFGGRRGGPGNGDPGQIDWNGATVKNMIMTAYGVKNYQVSGPSWLDEDRYTIAAKVPAGATKEQVPLMWQNLLADRFGLKVHRETREIPIYEVTVAKNGPKLKESDPEPPPPKVAPDGPPPPPLGRLKMDADGCPEFPGGRGGTSMMMMPGRFRMCAKDMTIANLAQMLTNQLSRPVIDKTGLTGKYDFKLEFEPEGQAAMMMGPGGRGGIASAAQSGPPAEGGAPGPGMNTEPAPPITEAFQKQLGLKMEARKAPADIVVVDKIERSPVDN